MNHEYDALRSLYRAARAEEQPSRADRHAVRMTLIAAAATGVQVTTAGAAASVPSIAAAASAVGVKAVAPLLFGGKFLGGLLVGAALGTAVSTTAYVVQPKKAPVVTVTNSLEAKGAAAAPRAYPAKSEAAPAAQGELPPSEELSDPVKSPVQAAEQRLELAATLPMQPAAQESANSVRLQSSHAMTRTLAPQRGNADRLQQENEALAKVQAALNSKEPNLALALLDEQQRVFSSGKLAEERAAAYVLALCAAGHKLDAEQARVRFVAAYPNSPLTKRVHQSCDLP